MLLELPHGETKSVPLAKGLIGSRSQSINGQLEVTYHNYKTVRVTIWRKMYFGLLNVNFSITDTDLSDIIEILIDAQKKIENYWLSKIAKQKF